jgi:hypothetical protein
MLPRPKAYARIIDTRCAAGTSHGTDHLRTDPRAGALNAPSSSTRSRPWHYLRIAALPIRLEPTALLTWNQPSERTPDPLARAFRERLTETENPQVRGLGVEHRLFHSQVTHATSPGEGATQSAPVRVAVTRDGSSMRLPPQPDESQLRRTHRGHSPVGYRGRRGRAGQPRRRLCSRAVCSIRSQRRRAPVRSAST